jgi:hypothetical protein
MSKCIATTLKGTRCSRNSKIDYCSQHLKQYGSLKECNICLEKIGKNTTFMLPCKHEFHKTCIDKWSGPCPLCRKEWRKSRILTIEELLDIVMFAMINNT